MSCEIENRYVVNVYDKIADRFSRTRGYIWGGVKTFINSLDKHSHVLDAGCGNGKNMFRKDCSFIGTDISSEMIKIINNKGLNGIIADIRDLPFNDNTFDAVISVAVLHHIYSENTENDCRVKAIKELIRVTKSGGQIFIQVWENMKNKNEKFERIKDNDYLVKWNNMDGNVYKRYYHLFDRDEFINLFNNIINIQIISVNYEMENWIIILKKL